MGNNNQAMKHKQQKWKTLAKNCVKQYTCPVLVENGKYILFIGYYNDTHGIVMYDVQNDRYPESLKSPQPKDTELYMPAMTFNSKRNVIYVFGGGYPCFMIHDLDAKTWKYLVTENTAKEIAQKYNVIDVGMYSRMICDAHQRLHVIGGNRSNTHMIFNDNKQVFEEQFVFEQFRSICGFGLVSDSVNNRLILFGGCDDDDEYLDNIWFFNLSTHSWTECKKIKMKKTVSYFGFVLLDEIQIILVFGGQTSGDSFTDSILMFDFNDYTCIECRVKCPKKGNFHAQLVPQINENLTSIHLFDYNSKDHWCLNLESILPPKINIQEMQIEIKEEQGRIYPTKDAEKKLNQKIEQKMNDENFALKLKMEEMEHVIQQTTSDLVSIRKQMLEIKEEKQDLVIVDESKEGNFNLKHIKNKELLNAREKSFKSYFFSVVAKMADKYYESFVRNAFNDLEIVIEFARMEDKNESLRILCKECGMNGMHARQLLRRLSQLSLSNSEFEYWFKTQGMFKYYEMMLDAGVVTFAMFESTFVCCADFVEFLGEENEKQGIHIWRNVPLGKNMAEKKYIENQNNNQPSVTIDTPTNVNIKLQDSFTYC